MSAQPSRRRGPAAPAIRKYVMASVKLDAATNARLAAAAALAGMDKSAWMSRAITEALSGVLVIDRRKSAENVDLSEDVDRAIYTRIRKFSGPRPKRSRLRQSCGVSRPDGLIRHRGAGREEIHVVGQHRTAVEGVKNVFDLGQTQAEPARDVLGEATPGPGREHVDRELVAVGLAHVGELAPVPRPRDDRREVRAEHPQPVGVPGRVGADAG
ncbi:MAG: hypothetical protein WKF75_17565, partial [Singulisphaera sp.]